MYVSLVASHRDPEWYRSAHMEFGGCSAVNVDSSTEWLELYAGSLVLIQNVLNLTIINYLALYIIYSSCSIGVSIFHDGRYYNHSYNHGYYNQLPPVRTGFVTCNGNEPNISYCKLSSCSSDCNGEIGVKCDNSKRYTN